MLVQTVLYKIDLDLEGLFIFDFFFHYFIYFHVLYLPILLIYKLSNVLLPATKCVGKVNRTVS